jgi:hypothetical protein
MLIDFFVSKGANVLPFWFQATGLIVLGYLLGVHGRRNGRYA